MDVMPSRVGRYGVVARLGAGGMASVYLATAVGVGGFEREVALKVLHPHLREDSGVRQDLIEEAKIAARIRHPNVVPVLEVGEDSSGVFLVMEYVEGETLSQLARAVKGGLPIPIALRLLADALAGLHAAHELRDAAGQPLGVVHRDFSPQNILVGLDGVARLTDFGIARAFGRAALTKTGLVKGKVAYMSPEQARGEALDRRADVWAAGVLVWELLADRRLHEVEGDMAILARLVSDEPLPNLCAVRADVPQKLGDIVAQALARDPGQRLPDVSELRDALLSSWKRAADTAEVARFVSQCAGARVEERRARATRARQQAGSRASGKRWLARVAIAGTVTTLAVAITAVLSRAGGSRAASAAPLSIVDADPVAPAPPHAAELTPVANAFVEPPSSAEPTPSAEPRARSSDNIAIEANAPIAALVVGGKNIALTSPTRRLEVVIDPAQRGTALKVVATTTDHRQAQGQARAGAVLKLVFPAAVVSRATAGPRSSAAPPAIEPALIDDPYGRRP